MNNFNKILLRARTYFSSILSRMVSIFMALKSKTGLISLVVVCTIVAVFFAIRPQANEFVILHRDLSSDLKEEANSHISFALGRANARNEIAQTIVRSFDGGFEQGGDVSQAFGATRFEDILSSNFEVKVDESLFNFSWGVNFILLIQSLSDKFFSENGSILVVNQFSKTKNNNGIAINLTSQGIATRNVPLEGYQSKDEFRTSLSKFLTKFVLEKKKDCQTRVCGSDLPEKAENLEILVNILDAMVARKSDGVCKEFHDEATCISVVQKAILEIDDSEEVVEFLNFIAALIDLQGGLLLSGATDRIGNALDNVEIYVSPLRKSLKFSEALSDEVKFQSLLKSLGLEDLGLTLVFINTIEFYLAGRKQMHAGQPAMALRNYEQVEGEPEWFRGFKEGIILSTSFDPKIGEIEDLILYIQKMEATNFKRTHIKNALLGQMITSLLETRTGDLKSKETDAMQVLLLKSWKLAIEQAPSFEDRYGAQIEFARSLFALDRDQEAQKQLEQTVSELAQNTEDKKFHMAFFSAAAVLSLQKDYARAEWALRISANLRPKNVCAAENLDDFKPMREAVDIDFSKIISELRIKNQPTC